MAEAGRPKAHRSREPCGSLSLGCERLSRAALELVSAPDAADPRLLRARVDATLAAAIADDHEANKDICSSDAWTLARAIARRGPAVA